ncbi:MAG: cytochrome c1 [Rhodospirillaceae bacterium]|nr:cytochrome c1 [Rhodospirillaceae bacterium]MBT6117145.1 cytochrome c1 [Rhodospirillaceae bacterium]
MTRRIVTGLAAAILGLGIATAAQASGGGTVGERHWSFQGIFGTYDRAALRRGLQVFQGSCASCHGLKYIAFRNLQDVGFTEGEVKAIAVDYTIADGPDDAGDMFERDGKPSDRFPSPFANENAARASNGGALPPDLSLIVKARADGANYLYGLLTGYHDEAPKGVELMEGMYYNDAFSGNQIAMPPPLFADGVDYEDGTEATVEQMAADVTTFLAWAASPEMETRKRLGIKVILFLLVLSGLLYAVKRKVWADVH